MKAILTYHSIDPSGSPISVDAPTFRRHIRWLASGAVRVVGIPELLALPPSIAAVALTFDDAFATFGTAAAPLLMEHALPATLFVVTDYVGRTNAWEARPSQSVPTLPLLGWHALARLAEQGITLGAHTRTHPDLTRLPATAQRDEIAGSVERLTAETGQRPKLFAYPYGRVNDDVATIAAESCTWACTTELRALGAVERPQRIPRVDMYYFRAPTRLESWGSPRLQRYLWLRSQARRMRRGFAAITERP
jgi:peptidoglycan/xylan/chitin deacetylase (PgdA/CDA1 family)